MYNSKKWSGTATRDERIGYSSLVALSTLSNFLFFFLSLFVTLIPLQREHSFSLNILILQSEEMAKRLDKSFFFRFLFFFVVLVLS